MAVKRKADHEKIKKILSNRGYKGGKPPRGHDVHHIKPLAEGKIRLKYKSYTKGEASANTRKS